MRYNGVPNPLSALQERNMALHTACLGHFPGSSRFVNMIRVISHDGARPSCPPIMTAFAVEADHDR